MTNCNCDNQILRMINDVAYTVCEVCGMCYDKDGEAVGYVDELEKGVHRGQR